MTDSNMEMSAMYI